MMVPPPPPPVPPNELADDGPLAEMGNARRSPISDSSVLLAFDRAVLRHGPQALTLRHIAEEAGLSPPTLLQRFGSKKALHHASARRRARLAKKVFRYEGGDPLQVVTQGFQVDGTRLRDPRRIAHAIALHHLELADADIGPVVREGARQRRAALRALLDRGVAEGRLLPDTATGRLAHALEVAYRGALTGFVTFRSRSAGQWVEREIRRTLSAHRS